MWSLFFPSLQAFDCVLNCIWQFVVLVGTISWLPVTCSSNLGCYLFPGWSVTGGVWSVGNQLIVFTTDISIKNTQLASSFVDGIRENFFTATSLTMSCLSCLISSSLAKSQDVHLGLSAYRSWQHALFMKWRMDPRKSSMHWVQCAQVSNVPYLWVSLNTPLSNWTILGPLSLYAP